MGSIQRVRSLHWCMNLQRGLRAAMGYTGARNIRELWEKARFEFLTPLGAQETKPHDVLLPTETLGA